MSLPKKKKRQALLYFPYESLEEFMESIAIFPLSPTYSVQCPPKTPLCSRAATLYEMWAQPFFIP